MNTTNIVVANDCLGTLLLLNVRPDVKDGEAVGFKYNVLSARLCYEKFNIRIPGKQQLDVPEGADAIEVAFDDLVIRPYVIDGKFGIVGTAKAIRKVNTKA